MKDLTEGKPQSVLWRFSVPMLISVIFQQLYNIADSVIAGKFAGEDALAAVGASYPITMIFMAIAVGSNIGCSVIISQFFGAKQNEKMKTCISTTLITSFLLSLILIVSGLLGTDGLMRMIHTPDNIFSDGALYLRITISGFMFLYLYNVVTGIFTALGDSKTPLYFLITSSVGNILLDILFVAGFDWGVAGVAWATFLAQGVACILAVITLWIRMKTVKTQGKLALFSGTMLLKISKIAIPSILQQSFISIGNIFIQSLVNSFGSSVIAGYSAAIKLNTFTITSFTTLGNGISSFTAQNIGAGKRERIREGFKASTKMALLAAIPFFIVFFVFGREMIQLFMKEVSIVALDSGITFLRIVSPFYFIVSIKLMADGVLRGAEAMKEFMTATFTDLILRVVLAYLLSAQFGTNGIWMSWPIGWSVAAVLSLIFYKRRSHQFK